MVYKCLGYIFEGKRIAHVAHFLSALLNLDISQLPLFESYGIS